MTGATISSFLTSLQANDQGDNGLEVLRMLQPSNRPDRGSLGGEGRACHARRSGIDDPTLGNGPDKRVPPKSGRDKRVPPRGGRDKRVPPKAHRTTRILF